MARSRKKIGIVGGGLLGMTLALRLSQKGFKITLLEAATRTGGLACPTKIGDYIWDRFYHVMLASDSNLINLLEELNLTGQIHWSETKTGFYIKGQLYSMSTLLEFLKFPPLTPFDKIRLGWTIFYASKIGNWKRLERISVINWLARHSGKRTFERIWLPLLRSKLGSYYTIASASFIWATISRMYAARRSGVKKEMFGYVNGGYAAILDRFQALLNNIGVDTLCNLPVRQIENNEHGVMVKSATGEFLKFDKVIITLPCSELPNLCPQLTYFERKLLNNVIYQGLICASLILKKPLSPYYITNITDDWLPFTGVIEMTTLVDKKHFDGNSLVYLPRYLTHEDSFWEKRDEELKEIFLSGLENMYATFRRADVVALNIARVRQFPMVPTLNYSTEFLPPTRISLEHVLLVNSAQIANGTTTVNAIVGLANRKAAEIIEYIDTESTTCMPNKRNSLAFEKFGVIQAQAEQSSKHEQ
ncbi:MAG: FAD-dependent oxidoreductase [Candidatus Hodarchaeota archaeon]